MRDSTFFFVAWASLAILPYSSHALLVTTTASSKGKAEVAAVAVAATTATATTSNANAAAPQAVICSSVIINDKNTNNINYSSKISRRDVLLAPPCSVTAGTLLCLFHPAMSAAASAAAAPPPPSVVGTTLLSDGTSVFPLASFGLQIYDDATAYRLTTTALEVGYRNFFASVLAGNQEGFAKAVRDSGIPREELYITGSVVSNRAVGYDAAYRDTQRGIQANLQAFQKGDITYLDQIMLDYPGPDCDSIRGQWAAFQAMYDAKLTKSLSVSNFSPAQLDCLLGQQQQESKVKPVVNQLPFSVAYHPGGRSVLAENEKRCVLVQAWAPLGGSLGGRFDSKLKGECARIGLTYRKSWAQVALRWIVQQGAAFTTQSRNPKHFAEDLQIFDFELTEAEMKLLNGLA